MNVFMQALIKCFSKRGISLDGSADQQWLIMAGDRVVPAAESAEKYVRTGLSVVPIERRTSATGGKTSPTPQHKQKAEENEESEGKGHVSTTTTAAAAATTSTSSSSASGGHSVRRLRLQSQFTHHDVSQV